VENAIRWRTVVDADGTERKETNSRLVKWSDGTMSIVMGDEVIDCNKKNLKNLAHLYAQLPGIGGVEVRFRSCGVGEGGHAIGVANDLFYGDRYISPHPHPTPLSHPHFLCLPLLLCSPRPPLLAWHHVCAVHVQAPHVFSSRLSFRPSSISSSAGFQRITQSVADKQGRANQVKMINIDQDPEEAKRQAVKAVRRWSGVFFAGGPYAPISSLCGGRHLTGCNQITLGWSLTVCLNCGLSRGGG